MFLKGIRSVTRNNELEQGTQLHLYRHLWCRGHCICLSIQAGKPWFNPWLDLYSRSQNN
jgi:hypothetical protein